MIILTLALAAAPLALADSTEKPEQAEKKVELTKAQQDAVIAAYHALKAPEPENKKIEKLPEHLELARIDVSPRIRSASFGHKTWLLVPKKAQKYFIEYGRSTNTAAALFGPFDVKTTPATPPATTANDDGATGTPTLETGKTKSGLPPQKSTP